MKLAGAVAASGAAVILLAGCSSPSSGENISSEVVQQTVETSPSETPSVETVAEPSPSPSPVQTTVKTEVGEVTATAGQFFLLPAPTEMLSSGDPETWQWSLDYASDELVAPTELTSFPDTTDSPEVAQGDAKGGQLWQVKPDASAGDVVMKYSYVDPAQPTAKVEGTYTVRVVAAE